MARYIQDNGWMDDALFVRCIERHRATPSTGRFYPEGADLNYQAADMAEAEAEAATTSQAWGGVERTRTRREKNRVEKAAPDTVRQCMAEIKATLTAVRDENRRKRGTRAQSDTKTLNT